MSKLFGVYSHCAKKRPAIARGAFGVCRFISRADAGEFFVGVHVHNLELFGVHAGVRPEGQLAEVAFLHLDEMLLVLRPQPVQHGGMHDDAQLEVVLVARALLQDFLELALDQIRTVDKARLVKRLGEMDSETAAAVLDTLGELFAP